MAAQLSTRRPQLAAIESAPISQLARHGAEMNPLRPLASPSKWLYRLMMTCRRLLPRQTCKAFGTSPGFSRRTIERIYVINLERRSDRWTAMGHDFARLVAVSGA